MQFSSSVPCVRIWLFSTLRTGTLIPENLVGIRLWASKRVSDWYCFGFHQSDERLASYAFVHDSDIHIYLLCRGSEMSSLTYTRRTLCVPSSRRRSIYPPSLNLIGWLSKSHTKCLRFRNQFTPIISPVISGVMRISDSIFCCQLEASRT